MTKHRNPKQFTKASPAEKKITKQYAVTTIVLELALLLQLTETERDILQTFERLRKKNKRFPTVKQVTVEANLVSQRNVRRKLWNLVRDGHLAAYRKHAHWQFCSRKEAKRMLKVLPDETCEEILVAYCDLPKSDSDDQPV